MSKFLLSSFLDPELKTEKGATGMQSDGKLFVFGFELITVTLAQVSVMWSLPPKLKINSKKSICKYVAVHFRLSPNLERQSVPMPSSIPPDIWGAPAISSWWGAWSRGDSMRMLGHQLCSFTRCELELTVVKTKSQSLNLTSLSFVSNPSRNGER